MLVYGPYGAGKTRLIGSCTLVKEMQDFLLIDSDKGSKTLKVFPAAISIPIDNLGEINEVFRFLREHVIYRDDPQRQQHLIELNEVANIPLKPGGEPYRFRSIGIDSLAAIGDLTMAQALGVEADEELDSAVPVAEWPQFRANMHTFLRILKTYRKLPVNLLMTCPSKFIEVKNESGTQQKVRPDLIGQLANHVQGAVDVVAFIQSLKLDGKDQRHIQFTPSGKIEAKNRFPKLDGIKLVDATMRDIMVRAGLIAPPAPTPASPDVAPSKG
jgi:hypothetical protein